MLINHPTDGATRVFVLFNSNHQVALHIDGTAAICIFVELYEIVQLSRWSHFAQFDMIVLYIIL